MLLKSVLPVMSVYPLKSVVSLTSVDHLAGVASLAIFVPAGSVFLGREVNLRKKTKTVRFSPTRDWRATLSQESKCLSS